jgi:serine O-acetyltransferase
MWAELRADARMNRALRWPGDATWRSVLPWISSRGLLVLAVQRIGHHYLLRREREGWTISTLGLRLLMAIAPRVLALVSKSDVASRAIFEPGVYVSDQGYLILGPERVGSGTLIHERVTIGVTAGGSVGPSIGRNVWIGPDSIIYGQITLGDGVTVLPGSVVSTSVSAGKVVGGNPATIVRADFDNASLRRSLESDVDRARLINS